METDPAKLVTILGDRTAVTKLIEMAKSALTSPVRMPLDALGLDAATRKRLDAASIRDVEGVLEADSAKLAEVFGDRATASKQIEAAKRLLNPPSPPRSPAPARGAAKPKRKGR